MLAEKVLKALNEQLNHEEKNSRLYLQIAAWCDAGDYRGCAKWFYTSADDETKHKMMIAKYIADRNEKFELAVQEKPKCEYAGLMEIFTLTMDTEKSTTKALQDLYRMVMTEGDFLTAEFLLPLLKEQVEEEDKVQTVLDFIKIAGLQPPGLALIDNKVGKLA